VAGLFVMETLLMALAGILLGLALLWGCLAVARPMIDTAFGLYLPPFALTARDAAALGGVLAAAVVAGGLPAMRAYRTSLAEGMTIRS
jgi:putative ABC transport system permease protein